MDQKSIETVQFYFLNKSIMKKSIFILLFSFVLICIAKIGISQDIHFSQFSQTPTIFNPATAGSFNGDFRALTIFRSQWNGVGEGDKTIAMSVDMGRKSADEANFMGFGVNFYNDKSGAHALQLTSVEAVGSYNLKIDKSNRIAFGLNLGMNQYSVNPNDLQWDNQYDGNGYNSNLLSGETSEFENFSNFNTGFGFVWSVISGTTNNQRDFQFGAAVEHLTSSNFGFTSAISEKQFKNLVIHAKSDLRVKGKNITVQPSLLYQNQGPQSELVFGSNFKFILDGGSRVTGLVNQSSLSLGIHYRLNDALIPSVQFNKSNFSLGFAYDSTISDFNLNTDGLGAFEFYLKFYAKSKKSGSRGNARYF